MVAVLQQVCIYGGSVVAAAVACCGNGGSVAAGIYLRLVVAAADIIAWFATAGISRGLVVAAAGWQ